MAKLSSLVLDIRTNTAKFQQGMDRVEKKMDKFGRNAKRMLKAAAAIGGATGLGLLVKRNLEAADAIGKAADTVGLGVEAYQELAQAAERAGVDQSQFTSNMTAFVKRVGEAKQNTGPLVTFLKKYDEGLLRSIQSTTSQEQALNVMANAIQNAASETDRAALANAAFSRAGVQMTIALKNGSEGLDSARRRARELGNVISEDLVRGAENANDKFDEMTTRLKTELIEAVVRNDKAIIGLSESIVDLVGSLGSGLEALNKFGDSLGRNIADMLDTSEIGKLKSLNSQIADLNARIKQQAEYFDSKDLEYPQALLDQSKKLRDLEKERLDILKERQGIGLPTSLGSQGIDAPKDEKPKAEQVSKVDPVVGDAAQKLFDEKAAEKLDRVNEFLLTEEERVRESYLNRRVIVQNAFESEIISTERRNEILTALEAKKEKEITKIQKENMSEREKFLAMSTGAQIKTILQSGVKMTQGVAQSSKEMFRINKALALANAAVTLPDAVLKSWNNAGGYPWGIVPAGLMLATGLAQINAIASTSFGGRGSVPPSAAGGGAGSVTGTVPLGAGQSVDDQGIESSRDPQGGTTVIQLYGDDGATYTQQQMDRLLDGLEDRINKGDQIIIRRESRQAREIRG